MGSKGKIRETHSQMTALDSRNRSTILRDVEQLGIGAGLAFLPSLPSLLLPTLPYPTPGFLDVRRHGNDGALRFRALLSRPLHLHSRYCLVEVTRIVSLW